MAPKRPNPKEDPPAPSSSEEEEEDDSSTDDDEGKASSDEERPPQMRTLVPHSQGQPKKPASDSDSEVESETDTDSDPPPPKSSAVLHDVKPIASKPKPQAHAAPASSSKPTAAAKRGSETEREGKDAKRRKETAERDEDEDGKNGDAPSRVLFQRLWGESDEIAVLSGLIEFAEKRGADPLKDMAGFYDFIKKSLSVDVSLAQVKEKVSRLRKKFKNHAKGKNGLDKSFSKAHDQKSFDLSKKIWDSEGEGLLGRIGDGKSADGKSNGKAKKNGASNGATSSKSVSKAADLGAGNGDGNAKSIGGGSNGVTANKNASNADLGAGNGGGGGGEERMEIDGGDDQQGVLSLDWSLTGGEVKDFVVKKGLEIVEGSKRNELGKRWKELDIATLELFIQRNQLITDQAQSILDSYKAEERD